MRLITLLCGVLLSVQACTPTSSPAEIKLAQYVEANREKAKIPLFVERIVCSPRDGSVASHCLVDYDRKMRLSSARVVLPAADTTYLETFLLYQNVENGIRNIKLRTSLKDKHITPQTGEQLLKSIGKALELASKSYGPYYLERVNAYETGNLQY